MTIIKNEYFISIMFSENTSEQDNSEQILY